MSDPVQSQPAQPADPAQPVGELATADPDEAGATAPGLGAPSLAAACEAVLLLADQPLDLVSLAGIVGRPVPEVVATVRGLAEQYTQDGRGFDLREAGGGWRFYTRADCADVVTRFVVGDQQARLSQAALETLAIVAYRQPISRARISAVRGVNVDGVVRTLITRGLIVESGPDPDSHAMQLRTTPYFLERLGIASLAELPPIADHVPNYDDLGELADLA